LGLLACMGAFHRHLYSPNLSGKDNKRDGFGSTNNSILRKFSSVTSVIVILLLVSFLITSVDSAIYVLSMFTDYGNKEPKKKYRLAWAVLIFIFCEAIVVLGTVKPDSNVLTAMQKFLIISSLPFALLSVLFIVLFSKKLLKRRKEKI
jgi:glycine betaine transporter